MATSKKLKAVNLNQSQLFPADFPCQPHSIAGKRKGGEDERNLFPEMLRIIRENKPEWVLGENVYGLLNTDDGRFFEQEVITPLEDEGYSVQPYIIPASAIGAVHRRDRLWILAHARLFGQTKHEKQTTGIKQQIKVDSDPISLGCSNEQEENRELIRDKKRHDKTQEQKRNEQQCRIGESIITCNPTGKGLQKPEAEGFIQPFRETERANLESITNTPEIHKRDARLLKGRPESEIRGRSGDSITTNTMFQRQPRPGEHRGRGNTEKNGEREVNRIINDGEFQRPWIEVATQLCRVHVASTDRVLEPGLVQRRVDGIGGSVLDNRYRRQRLEGLGNGIQWEIAYIFFELIKEIENGKSNNSSR